ncbi:MAG: hypothetical protein CMH82_05500 [Nocardioides sp.]|nr:hypothetical protein [Nocardioides sp.]
MTDLSSVKPFYPWVGGKRRLLDLIQANTPTEFLNFHEPFLGGGAVALQVMASTGVDTPRTYYLSDLNAEVIVTWEAVRDDPEAVISEVRGHAARHERRYFNAVRQWDRNGLLPFRSPTERAGRFIYLLRGCYRAMWEEDDEGFCTSAFGFDSVPFSAAHERTIWAVHELLNARDVVLTTQPFKAGEEFIRAADFVYLDPPYATDVEGHVAFDAYVAGGTDGKQFQTLVRDYIDRLTFGGAYALASNRDSRSTRFLYDGWNQIDRQLMWSLGHSTSGGNPHSGTEKLFANYLLYVALGYEQERKLSPL